MAPKPGIQTRSHLRRTNTSQPVAGSTAQVRNRPSGASSQFSNPEKGALESPHDVMSRVFEEKKKDLQCHKCKEKGKYKTYGSEPNRKLLRLICSVSLCRTTLSGTKVIQLLNKHGANLPEDLGLPTVVPAIVPESSHPLVSDDPQHQLQASDQEHTDTENFVTPRGTQEAPEKEIINILKDQIETLKAQNDRQSKQITELTAQIKLLTDLLTTKNPQKNNSATQIPTVEQVITLAPTDQDPRMRSNEQVKDPTPAESIAQVQSKETTSPKAVQKQPAQNAQKTSQKPAMTYIEALEKGAKDSIPSNIATGIAEATKELEKAGFAPTKAPRRRTTTTATNADGTPAQLSSVILKPEPEAVYFGGIPRGPIGKLRRALRNALPKWAILSISFIGDSVTEILCHKALVQRLIAALKFMKFRHLKNYDPTSAVGDTDEDQNTIQYRGSCYHRWLNASKKTYSEVCKVWYEKQAEALMVRHPNISKSKPFPRRNRDGEVEPSSTNNAEVSAQDIDKETSTNEQNEGADDVFVSDEGNKEKEDNNAPQDNQEKENHQTEDEDEIQKQGHPAGDHQ